MLLSVSRKSSRRSIGRTIAGLEKSWGSQQCTVFRQPCLPPAACISKEERRLFSDGTVFPPDNGVVNKDDSKRSPRRRSIFEIPQSKDTGASKDEVSTRQRKGSLFDLPRQQSVSRPRTSQEESNSRRQRSLFETHDSAALAPPPPQHMESSQSIHNAQQSISLEEIKQRLGQLQEVMLTFATTQPSAQLSLTDELTTIDNADAAQGREELFQAAKDLLDDLQRAVAQGNVNPSGKHGRDVSSILARIAGLLSASYHKDLTSNNQNVSVFDECLWILALLDEWNLNRQEAHYQHAILAAVREQRWRHAAELYQQQIDRDESGFCPVSYISVSSPVGLYAIAKHAQQQEEQSVVEAVMEAVTTLALISPSDQERHILAAGTAIGLAGESEGLVSYLQASPDASDLGQPLIAAAMHASILDNKSDKAMEIFQTLSTDGHGGSISSEFHWGGGQDKKVMPLCRDLAMRAAGTNSRDALTWLGQALEEELTISDDALYGVLDACERDGAWRQAVDILLQVLGHTSEIVAVTYAELLIPSIHDDNIAQINIDKGRMLLSVMRACNNAEEFGVSLLCQSLFEACTPRSQQSSSPHLGSPEQSMFGLIQRSKNSAEWLSATMVALCGVSCYDQAQALFELASEFPDQPDSTPEAFNEAQQLYEYAQACADSSAEQRRWAVAQRHIHRIVKVIQVIQHQGEMLGQEQLLILSNALAAALRACTAAMQPSAGIILSDYAQSQLARFTPPPKADTFLLGDNRKEAKADLALTDAFVAEKMKALESIDQSAAALTLLSSNVDSFEGTPEKWTQSTNVVLDILAKSGNLDEAAVLFQRHVKTTRGDNVGTFCAAAQAFARGGRWNDVGDTYHLAEQKGCVSAPLGLLSMRAVVELNLTGKLRILRGIIRETSQEAGTDPVHWLESRYWRLKRLINFKDLRLLMWWNDPGEAHLDELQFAIDSFEKRQEDGVQAKNAVLRLIISCGRLFDGDAPDAEHWRPRVPRDQDAWAELVARVVAESINLRNDDRFIDEASTALRHLGCYEECLTLVEAAVQRGVRVGEIAADQALLAEEALGIHGRKPGEGDHSKTIG